MKMKIIMPQAMMINKSFIIKILLIILGGFLTIKDAKSQNDFESWNCIAADFKLSSKSSIGASTEIRLNDNALGFKKYLIDAGYEYKILKQLKGSITYRYSRFDDIEAYKNEHLFFVSFEYGKKIDRFSISLQTRYQRAFEVLGWKTHYKTEDYWRNKISANYNIYQSPITPFASYELFTETSKLNNIVTDKYRLFAGLKYKLNNSNNVSIYYGIQKSFIKTNNSYILGLKYSLSFKSEKQKDDE